MTVLVEEVFDGFETRLEGLDLFLFVEEFIEERRFPVFENGVGILAGVLDHHFVDDFLLPLEFLLQTPILHCQLFTYLVYLSDPTEILEVGFVPLQQTHDAA